MEAVGSSEDPGLVDEGSSADVDVVLTPPGANLPGMERWTERWTERVSILGHCLLVYENVMFSSLYRVEFRDFMFKSVLTVGLLYQPCIAT